MRPGLSPDGAVMPNDDPQPTIDHNAFLAVDLRVGTVVSAAERPTAPKPAYRIEVDFGPAIGVLTTSSQVADLYRPEDLVGRQVVGVVNVPPKRVGEVHAEFLLTGFVQPGGAVVLAVPERPVADGTRLA